MRHVPPPLAELTAQAQSLTAEGDLTGARDVLAPALDPAAADPREATPDLALAAALQARILIALGDPHAARLWAGFAHAAEDRLHGPADERTIAAAATHAAVLHRIGNHGRAAQLYHNLVAELITREGPLSPRVLAAEADLATAEHAAGHCTAARARLEDVWTRHREVYGDASAAGIKMLARLGAMERECNRTAQASVHLALAQELCARYLPADHSLAQQIARLAGTPATGRHICGRVQQSNGPASGNPTTGNPTTGNPASGTLTRPAAGSSDGPPGAPLAGPGGGLVSGPAGAPLAGPGGGLINGSAGGPLAGSDAGPHAGREPMAQGEDGPRGAALGEPGRGEPYVTQRSSGGVTDGVTRMPATLADAHPVVRQERRHAIPEQRAGSQDRPRDIGDRLAALDGPATTQAGHVAGQRSTGPQDELAAVPPGVLDNRGT
ncbi:fibronectin type III domain-containing protein, partial [Winogradskya humida]|uniref:fibronectin type III domain-containing protein n=1 Tax=Winogradskya humida TaxID=113566 RepID=UPI001EF38015